MDQFLALDLKRVSEAESPFEQGGIGRGGIPPRAIVPHHILDSVMAYVIILMQAYHIGYVSPPTSALLHR